MGTATNKKIFVLIISSEIIVFMLALYFIYVFPVQRHFNISDNIESEIERMAEKCPGNIGQEEWDVIIFSTRSCVANTIESSMKIPHGLKVNLYNYVKSINQKDKISIRDVKTIWDISCEISPDLGPIYSSRFRPPVLRDCT